VKVKGTFRSLAPARTKLISEQEFIFKGANEATISSDVKDSIKSAHRRHMEDFKRFAENECNQEISWQNNHLATS